MSRPLLTIALLIAGCGAPPSTPGEERGTWGTDPLPRASCVGDGDGVIDAGELQAAGDLDLHATFAVTAGEGDRPADPWDLDPPTGPDDRLVDLGPRPPSSFWFGDRYPGADFAALLDAATRTWGLHALDEEGLWLLGLAGEDEGDTALAYDPPVLLVPTPLEPGDAWSVAAAAAGLADGLAFPRDLGPDGVVTLVHRWSFEALDVGDVRLPLGTLEALRVRATVATEAHNSAAGLVASDVQRVDLYLAECLGLVGRVRSRIDEPAQDFVAATEILRLGVVAELRE